MLALELGQELVGLEGLAENIDLAAHRGEVAAGKLVEQGQASALLVAQPDFGQTMLICLTWGGLFFISGMSWMWILVFAGAGAGGILSAYTLVPHVRSRIERFMNPEAGDTFQVQTAQEAFINGGWWGQGPGEGTFKRILPDSHTDFVFAVLGEEFGLVLCMFLALVFAFVVLTLAPNQGRPQ